MTKTRRSDPKDKTAARRLRIGLEERLALAEQFRTNLEERLEGAEATIAQLQRRAEEAKSTCATEHDIAAVRQMCIDDLDARLAAAAGYIETLEKRAETAETAHLRGVVRASKERARARMRHEDSTRDTVEGWNERDYARKIIRQLLEVVDKSTLPPDLADEATKEAVER